MKIKIGDKLTSKFGHEITVTGFLKDVFGTTMVKTSRIKQNDSTKTEITFLKCLGKDAEKAGDLVEHVFYPEDLNF